MYIEKKSNATMDANVNEATAALKGLLGIGGSSGFGSAATAPTDTANKKPTDADGFLPVQHSSKSKNRKGNTNATVPDPSGTTGNVNGGGNGKPKKKRGGKKKSKETPQKQRSQSVTQQNQQPAKKNQQSGQKKRNKSVNGGGGGNKNDNKNTNKNNSSSSTPQNFAWSAFQSSPDASKLPIPAFSPATGTDKPIVDTDAVTQLFVQDADTTKAATTSNAVPIRTPTVDEIESSVIPSSPPTRAKTSTTETSHAVADTQSFTGINLAALSKSPPPTNPTDDKSAANKNNSDVNEDIGANTNTNANTNAKQPVPSSPTQSTGIQGKPQEQQAQEPNQQPQQQVQPHAHAHHHHQQQPQQQHPHHGHGQGQMQMFSPAPPSPPGYMTIQVQVPMNLLPGRQMYVNTPAGFPVQIVVPQGIPPGMFIPVHIPAPPMHMMPPAGAGMMFNHMGPPPRDAPQHFHAQQFQANPPR